ACFIGPAQAQPPQQSWAAKFFPDGLTHDFGNVPWGAVVTYKFHIKNIYNVPFIVEQAQPGCGCTTAKKPSAVIPALGTEEIEATMDTRKILTTGQPKIVYITVRLKSVTDKPTDKIFASTCILTVSCVAKADLRFSQDKIVFGAVNLGQKRTQELDV